MWLGLAAVALYCYCRFPDVRRTFHWIGGTAVALTVLVTCVGTMVAGHP